MSLEQSVDSLIEAGWHVIDSDFDIAAFTHWRKQALDCVGALMDRPILTPTILAECYTWQPHLFWNTEGPVKKGNCSHENL